MEKYRIGDKIKITRSIEKYASVVRVDGEVLPCKILRDYLYGEGTYNMVVVGEHYGKPVLESQKRNVNFTYEVRIEYTAQSGNPFHDRIYKYAVVPEGIIIHKKESRMSETSIGLSKDRCGREFIKDFLIYEEKNYSELDRYNSGYHYSLKRIDETLEVDEVDIVINAISI